MISACACIFDMDGLLLDTEIIYTEVTQSIVSRYGKVFDWSIKGNMIGRAAADSAQYLVGALKLPITAEAYLEERERLLKQRFPGADALPGAECLIRHLHAHQVPIALATSSSRELFDLKTTRHSDWIGLFNAIVTMDDAQVGSGKPCPDLFLVAAGRLGADPGSVLVFEDAPSGLEAGIRAGMSVICVPDANMPRSRYCGAVEILQSLEDFQPSKYHLI